MENENLEEENEDIILGKINHLQKKIMNFLNAKLKIALTGNEIKLDLNNKNIGNVELMLLTGINFNNLEELYLRNNNISDISLLKEMNLSKIKKLDLSNNKINEEKFFLINKNIPDRNIKMNISQLKKLDLAFNKINNLNEISSKNNNNNFEIILDNNNKYIFKDFEEIKNLIIKSESKKIIDEDKKDEEDNNFNVLNSSDNINPNNNSNIPKNNENKNALINKIEKLEQKILYYFNNKLNVQITGNEIKLNLNNKNIGNLELELLSGVEFKNLEEIDLSHNNITNIEPIQYFKKAKKIDLSFNNINDAIPLKKLFDNNKEIQIIHLNNNKIDNIKGLKDHIPQTVIEINLYNNNIIQKEIEEIKDIIKNNSKSDKVYRTPGDEPPDEKINIIFHCASLGENIQLNVSKNISFKELINLFLEILKKDENYLDKLVFLYNGVKLSVNDRRKIISLELKDYSSITVVWPNDLKFF